jgi:hypothetical protein
LPRLCLLLLCSLPLAGCLLDNDTSAPPPTLQALETEDGAGALTSVTYLDRNAAGRLTRVRHYTGPGEDGVWKTGDDVLAQYAACEHSRSGPLLRDPLAELEGAVWLGDRFTARNCALDEYASAIRNETFTAASADGLWFTADDVAAPAITLQRTSSGHRRTVAAPQPCSVDCSTNLNDTGLGNIVYNPYAGLDIGEIQTLAVYSGDSSGLVQRLEFDTAALRYEFAGDRTLQRKTLESGQLPPFTGESNIVIDLLLLGAQRGAYEHYERLDDGSYLVRYVVRADAEVVEGIGASLTGQILLALLGWTVVEVDGVRYADITFQRIRAIHAEGRRQELVHLNSPGVDGVWGNEDDGVFQRQRYFYQ